MKRKCHHFRLRTGKVCKKQTQSFLSLKLFELSFLSSFITNHKPSLSTPASSSMNYNVLEKQAYSNHKTAIWKLVSKQPGVVIKIWKASTRQPQAGTAYSSFHSSTLKMSLWFLHGDIVGGQLVWVSLMTIKLWKRDLAWCSRTPQYQLRATCSGKSKCFKWKRTSYFSMQSSLYLNAVSVKYTTEIKLEQR